MLTLSGEELPPDFLVHEDESELNNQSVCCMFGCGQTCTLRMLANHVITTCSDTFCHVTAVDEVLYGKFKNDENLVSWDFLNAKRGHQFYGCLILEKTFDEGK